jgi:hypothetical protein
MYNNKFFILLKNKKKIIHKKICESYFIIKIIITIKLNIIIFL